MTKALVIFSGGQDSTTALFWALQKFDEVHCITFDYGQTHRVEVIKAEYIARLAEVASHAVVDIPNILQSVSPLLSSNDLEQYENFEEMDETIGERVELTFVPMRNTLFFTIAANYAVKLECDGMVTGICEEDDANYPDCTAEFALAFESLMNLSLGRLDTTTGELQNPIELHAPLIDYTKAETVELAHTLPGCWNALKYSHTSYAGDYPPLDKNHASVLRAHGFEKAGLPDPLILRAFDEGLMELPETDNYYPELVCEHMDELNLTRIVPLKVDEPETEAE